MTATTAYDEKHAVGQPTPEKIMQIGLAYWGSKTLGSAVELGVFTELAKGACDAETLTGRLNLNGRCSRDFFDALVSMQLLERESGLYRNAPDTEMFLDAAKPSYVGGFLEMSTKRLYKIWDNLTEALKTGRSQSEGASGDTFAELYSDENRLRLFLGAMTGISMGLARGIAQKFDWKPYKTFLDVGTAQGALPVEVAKLNPHIIGGGFDLPQVEPIFQDYVNRHGLQQRLNFHRGDFFKDELPQADVVVMGHILHDWNLEEKEAILAKAYKSLSPGGAVIVYDAMIDNDRRHNTVGLLMSLNMLLETHGGFDYTQDDCKKWLEKVGFKQVRFLELSPSHSMGIGVK